MRKLLIILGVPVDDLTMEQALDRIEQFIATGRATGRTHQVATVNADFVVKSLDDPDLRRILQEADMATPDGMPLVWGARLLGVHLEGRVTGADLVPALAERASKQGYRMFLLGAGPGVAQRAAENLQQRYPGIEIVGTVSPPNATVLEMDPTVVDAVKAAKPDILLVAFGNPKQEKWIHIHAREIKVPVCIGVGGTLDMIAGTLKRAPRWMQRSGLEWSYRLLQEPRRLWRRYVHDLFYFGYYFGWQWWVMRRGRIPPPALPTSEPEVAIERTTVLQIRGRLDVTNQDAFVVRAEQALATNPYLIISLADASFLDSAALGSLVALANRARDAGGELWLVAVPPAIASMLSVTRLDRFFEITEEVEDAMRMQRMREEPVEETNQPQSGWMVVKMPRTLDARTSPEVIDMCLGKMSNNPRLILDFTETVFLSSAGMAAMVRLNRTSREQGGELRVAGCSGDVLRGIRLVRLDTVIPLYTDVQTALGAVA